FTERFNLPSHSPHALNDIRVTLLSPSATSIIGRLILLSKQKVSLPYTISTGQTQPLGNWVIDGSENALVISGDTQPARIDQQVLIAISYDF
ncbi:MAG: hypothetical protein ABI977_09190, partial [Acidobacteriota bacterium]